jgi:hypothetical protein
MASTTPVRNSDGQIQTDEILRTYPEYETGFEDQLLGVYHPEKFPLIAPGGAFLKKAYQIGWADSLRQAGPPT